MSAKQVMAALAATLLLMSVPIILQAQPAARPDGSQGPVQEAQSGQRFCTQVTAVREYVRNTHHLAQVVWSNYSADGGRNYPIFIARIKRTIGVPGMGRRQDCTECWLIALAGHDSAQNFSFRGDVNNLAGTIATVIPVPSLLDSYAMAVVRAFNEVMPKARVVLMVGHSLGGITAQNIIYYAASGQFEGWPPQTNVITMGAPIVLYRIPDARVRLQVGVDSAALTDKYLNAAGVAQPVFSIRRPPNEPARDARLRFFAIGSDRVVIGPGMAHMHVGGTNLGLFQFENIQRFQKRDRTRRLVWLGATLPNVDPHDAYPLDFRLRGFDPYGADRPTDTWEFGLDPDRQYRCSSRPVAIADSRQALPPVPGIADFPAWFDGLRPEEFDRYWASPSHREQIESRLRHPGDMHEWLVVSRADDFKRWGVRYAEIRDCRTPTADVQFVCPVRGTGGHDGSIGTECHLELIRELDQSLTFDDFRRRLQQFAGRRLLNGIADLPCDLLRRPG